jgi:hypothetical protein
MISRFCHRYPLRNELPTHLRNGSGQRLRATMREARLKVRPLVTENHVCVLQPQSQAANFAAEKVHVSGDLSNDTIGIKSFVGLPQQTAQAHPGRQNSATTWWAAFVCSPWLAMLQGVTAITRRGLPEPPTIFNGAAMTMAPVGGS